MERPTIHAALVEISLTDTQSPMVPVAQRGLRPPSPRNRWWSVPLAVLGASAPAAVLLAGFVPSGQFEAIEKPYAIVPASAEAVAPRLELEEIERYDSDGAFLFVTIRQPELSILSWLMFRNEDIIEPRTYTEVYGDGTPQQQSRRGQRQMVSAKSAAEYVALTKLGYPIELVPGEIIIESIICLEANEEGDECVREAPSGKVLKADDKLVELDGQPIENVDDIGPILRSHQAGDLVPVKYERVDEDGVQSGEIEVIASPDGDDRVIVGFYPVDTTQVGDLPFPVKINTDDIGGPSAGLAFTLTLIDEITPGDLTGGKKIAVTGTMNVNGAVGAIGGLLQKASAVEQSGTDYFLVPAAQSQEELARIAEEVPRLTVIPVATLDEALAALAELGGNSDDLGQPGADYSAAD